MPPMPRRYAGSVRAAGVLALGLLVAAAVSGAGSAAPTAGLGHRTSWQVAPGVTYREWRFTDAAGPQRVHVLDVDPATPGVSLDYATNRSLRRREPTRRIVLGQPTAVGGTNASYFDISDTGAPAGVGQSRAGGLLHAPTSGWNHAFYQARDGSYHIGRVSLRARVPGHPGWPVTALNLPHVQPGTITLYSSRWGRSCGRCVVDRPGAVAREVRVRDGVVVRNTTHLLKGRVYRGLRLVGVGRGARLLERVAVGSHLTPGWFLEPRPLMAVTGSQVLVRAGRVVAHSDGLRAPRSAIGIDGDTGHVLLVTLDGRSRRAVGMRMHGWAKLLTRLGIDRAVNLDGGGSSTMVARTAVGSGLAVVNRPSLGHQRRVPDAVVVDYAPPG
jgi:phosphodiester glycosidase